MRKSKEIIAKKAFDLNDLGARGAGTWKKTIEVEAASYAPTKGFEKTCRKKVWQTPVMQFIQTVSLAKMANNEIPIPTHQ